MLKEIIRKEMLEHLLGLRFAIACVLCLLVVLTSLSVRGLDYTQSLDDFHQNTVMDRQALETAREPWDILWRNNRINIKPNPMKIFVQGTSAQNGGTVSLLSSLPARFVQPDIENTSVPLFPFVDMVFFVGVILSLMAIVFGYNAVSGEKENGTLRLLLSYSIPRDRVLLGKWLGGYLTLILPYIITIIGMVAVVLMQRDIDLSQGQWIRFMVFILLSLLYLASIYSLALWVSALTRRASTSIIVLVALWVVLVLALPNLSPYAAGLFGNPAAMDVSKARMDLRREIWDGKLQERIKAYDRENGFAKDWWEKTDVFDPAMKAKINRRYITLSEYSKEAHLELLGGYEKLDRKYTNDMDVKVRAGKLLSRFSPFSCLALSAVELAGVGIGEQRRVIDQVDAFNRLFVTYAYDEMIKRNKYFGTLKGGVRAPAWGTQRDPFPQFAYQPPAVAAYVRPVLLDALLLACFTILFFVLSFTAFLRYDVR